MCRSTPPLYALLLALGVAACAGAGELRADEPEREPTIAPAAASAEPERQNTPAVEPVPDEPEIEPETEPEPEPPMQTNRPPVAEPEAEPAPLDARWIEPVREITARYQGWGRVDDEARWAPWLCRMPRPATARISESDDRSTHGSKLYTLYAMDPVAYGAPASAMLGADPIDGLEQVVVKESFRPVPEGESVGLHPDVETLRLRPAVRDGKRFVPGEPQGLFVMMKVRGEPAGTDAGWVYATVSPQLQVTAAGTIDACMGCHQDAGTGRLFGLPDPRDAADGRPKADDGPPL